MLTVFASLHAILEPEAVPQASGTAEPKDVAGRSTTFQPVLGGTEHRSGETLLVAAYAGLWLLLLGWVLMQWTKQTALARRVAELESAVAGATREADKSSPPRGNGVR